MALRSPLEPSLYPSTLTSAQRSAERFSVTLGSLAGVPPLLLFSPQLARALPGWASGPSGEVPEECKPDYSDIWDDDFLQVKRYV